MSIRGVATRVRPSRLSSWSPGCPTTYVEVGTFPIREALPLRSLRLRGTLLAQARGAAHSSRGKVDAMKYGLAWLVGVPFSLVFLWFVLNQVGCGF